MINVKTRMNTSFLTIKGHENTVKNASWRPVFHDFSWCFHDAREKFFWVTLHYTELVKNLTKFRPFFVEKFFFPLQDSEVSWKPSVQATFRRFRPKYFTVMNRKKKKLQWKVMKNRPLHDRFFTVFSGCFMALEEKITTNFAQKRHEIQIFHDDFHGLSWW